MTMKDYKNTVDSFNTADFGEYNAETFINGNRYRKPTLYPSGEHPRLLFTKNSIGRVRENLTADENKYAYKEYIKYSETEWDGKFDPVTEEHPANYDAEKVAIIEAKAFRYAMIGDKKYGYEAIIAAKNALLTVNVPRTVSDSCRTYGFLMYVIACAYDWCYDLLTEEDKMQIIAGCVNRLGTEFEMCRYVGDGNILPVEQGTMFGHGAEDQLLVDYLSLAIACFNEAPEIYELVAGRILNDYIEGENFLLQSGSHWEGSCYGFCRTTAILISNTIFDKMTDGAFMPFTPKVKDVVKTTINYLRPDKQVYRIGDMNQNREMSEGPQMFWMPENAFYAGILYNDAYLKSVGYKYLKNYSVFMNSIAGLTCVQFLAVNDPEIPHTYDGYVPLINRTYFPLTNIFAKSAHDDKDAFGIYMTMPETCTVSHAHMECGGFQLFYKGSLASDSGSTLGRGGGVHRWGYAVQTISANSVLVYNPALRDNVYPYRESMFYSGGQSIPKSAYLTDKIEGLIHHGSTGQCKSLGVKTLEKDGKFRYAYMAGDMTGAYDDETVDEVSRYMIALATDNEKCPFAFITYDRIGAKDKSFHKSVLIHTQEEPKTDGKFAIITDTRKDEEPSGEIPDKYTLIMDAHKNYNGKMIVQTIGDETEYTVIGGEGKQWWLPGVDENGNYSLEAGRNLDICEKLVQNSMAEYGWGRIEISPKNHEKTNTVLTVMYVTDADNNDKPQSAEDISTDVLAGAEIFGKAVLFPKNTKEQRTDAAFEKKTDGECYFLGLRSGKWAVTDGDTEIIRCEVFKGVNMFSLPLKAGKYTLKALSVSPDY